MKEILKSMPQDLHVLIMTIMVKINSNTKEKRTTNFK